MALTFPSMVVCIKHTTMICDVIVLAAGSGTRFGEKKQFYPILGIPILIKTLRGLYQANCFRNCVVVVPSEDVALATTLLGDEFPRCIVISGGESRFLSSKKAVNYVMSLGDTPPDVVIIHDGVRPFVSASLLGDLYTAMQTDRYDGLVLSLPVHDSIIYFANDKEVEHTYIDRANVVCVQTPHIYKAQALMIALGAETDTSLRENAEIFFSAGYRLGFIEGDPTNIKVTTRADLRYFHDNQ